MLFNNKNNVHILSCRKAVTSELAHPQRFSVIQWVLANPLCLHLKRKNVQIDSPPIAVCSQLQCSITLEKKTGS